MLLAFFQGKKVKPRARLASEHWIKQEIVAFPGYRCGQCDQKYIEGMIECPGCRRRLVAPTDLMIMAEPDRPASKRRPRG